MILDGLYGAVEEIIKNTKNQFLQNDLGFYIIRHLKMVLLKHGIDEEKFFKDFNGVILDKEHLQKFKKEWRKQIWSAILSTVNLEKK